MMECMDGENNGVEDEQGLLGNLMDEQVNGGGGWIDGWNDKYVKHWGVKE